MNGRPPITVSSLDLARLEELEAKLPGAQALLDELNRAQVVEPKDMPAGVITMNSTARFVDENSGKELELTLVYPKDADGTPGKISVLAPVGSALLGLSVGQTIEWPLPGGKQTRLRILAVVYQPEAAGELHR